jgi:hypothetical protein
MSDDELNSAENDGDITEESSHGKWRKLYIELDTEWVLENSNLIGTSLE